MRLGSTLIFAAGASSTVPSIVTSRSAWPGLFTLIVAVFRKGPERPFVSNVMSRNVFSPGSNVCFPSTLSVHAQFVLMPLTVTSAGPVFSTTARSFAGVPSSTVPMLACSGAALSQVLPATTFTA